jgi:hypothetical protein
MKLVAKTYEAHTQIKGSIDIQALCSTKKTD